MQTLRKKTSPLKYKNETSRFMGEGVSFKAKLIGILEVSEARGDKMCQEALSDLKMAIRAAGEHKQRITITIALDGLRLRDEKTGDSLYHHPVHKISFIAQDMTDSRAFGYIFGSPDTGHRFFGIKTDKAASQVVIAMRDLFQVVFALKKKEIELAKQHLEKNSSPLFSDSSASYSKLQSIPHVSIKSNSDMKTETPSDSKSGTAVADLVDLELELNSLQQGLNQMERITPLDPFGSKDDPFGDSFISYPAKPILPPPPSSGRDRSSRTSESSLFSPKTPRTGCTVEKKDFPFSEDDKNKNDWFSQGMSGGIFEDVPSTISSVGIEPMKDDKHEQKKQEIMSQFDVFTELDPLGTGRSKPYIDPKNFFKELKNPPKKPLKELVTNTVPAEPVLNAMQKSPKNAVFSMDPFGEDPFVKDDPFADSDFSKQDPFETEFTQFANNFKFDANFEKIQNNESAPEPPPRPIQIKPPPLPPKKQNEIAAKPPPRPPYHQEESPYDFIEKYETAPSSLETVKDKTPPLPVPQRKTKFDQKSPQEEDYLTPIVLPKQKNDETITTTTTTVPSLEGLDITLSQLTLSGLNELAQKLNIPAGQLSNMTLAQLTNFLSNFIKSNKEIEKTSEATTDFPQFQADFAANFSNANNTDVPYDRYAVFRELIQEEIKQTKIDSEPEEIVEEKEQNENVNIDLDLKPLQENSQETSDKYAALREIVEKELKQVEGKEEQKNEIGDIAEEEEEELEEDDDEDEEDDEKKILNTNEETDVINKKNIEEDAKNASPLLQDNIIEYSSVLNNKENNVQSPVKEISKSPTNDVQTGNNNNNMRPTSGSLSDVISGSSPEVTGSNSDGKKAGDATAESWAIFDQATVSVESIKEKQTVQSEEGVSPWSSDSKEFGNSSPPEWRGNKESNWSKKRRDQAGEGWWDTSAEPEVHYCSSNRRSTDSYDEEYYECYDKPRRRKQIGNWQQAAAGGHSSSSRDVSPWEEEPRRVRDCRDRGGYRYPRHRRDSWDEDDDYEYEEDEDSRRFHWNRDGSERWCEDWSEDRRVGGHRRRRDPRDRWCCPDWEQDEHEKVRYGSGRWSNPEQVKWRERYYNRESQESPWEDEYVNNDNEQQSPYYLSGKRNWKQRPSSASEMDRKTGEIKSRHYLGTGGSDGERDRRYKGGRRSRSRDSQFSEPHRHKTESGPSRSLHRNKPHLHPKLDVEKIIPEPKETKKPSTLTRKKTKDIAKPEENLPSTIPRKSVRTKSEFNEDARFTFDESEIDSPTALRPIITLRQQTMFERSSPLLEREIKERKPSSQKYPPLKSKSMFEDDFSPSDKVDDHIASIKEEDDDFVGKRQFESSTRKRILNKNRASLVDHNLKKSESVNIFAREDDPFDDEFFCGENEFVEGDDEKVSTRNTELRWTEDFKN